MRYMGIRRYELIKWKIETKVLDVWMKCNNVEMGPKTLERGGEMYERGKRGELPKDKVCLRERTVR